MSEQAGATPIEDKSLFFHPHTLRNVLASWIIPGSGYFLTGNRKKGIIICVCLYAAYILGALLGGDLYSFDQAAEGRIRFAGALCQAGMGLPYMIFKFALERGTPLSLTYDYGTGYFLITGMINWLVVMDIFDISVKRK